MAKKIARTKRRRSPSKGRLPIALAGLHLKISRCDRSGIKVDGLPQNVTMQTAFNVRKLGIDSDRVAAELGFGIEARYAEEENPALVVGATFVATYKILEKHAGNITEDEAQEFFRQATLNTWPYWREFVQSTTARMGIMALSVPLLIPPELSRMKVGPLQKD